jgi:hypothetical protein
VITWATILSFATWRITSLLYVESSFAWLRKAIGIVEDETTGAMSYPCNWLGELWECFWCLSLLVAFVLAVIVYVLTDLNVFEAFLVWLASAAGALVLDVRYFARLRG